jgi:PAS domain S-box-containing protein
MLPNWLPVFDSIPHAALLLDASNTILAVNRMMKNLLDARGAGYQDKKCWNVFHGPSAACPAANCPCARMRQSRVIEKEEIYLEALGAYCVSSCSPLFDAEGSLEFIIHSVTELSERSKRQEEASRESELRFSRRQAALLELARGYDPDLPSALRKITEVSARALGVERASVWRFDAQDSAILCDDLYLLGADRHESPPDLAVRDFPRFFAALAGGRQVAADDARSDPATLELGPSYLEPLGIVSLLDAPIRRQGALVGVLCLEQVGEARAWTSGEKEFAASVADQATLALEAMERRLGEESLKLGERRLRNIIAGTNAGTWEWDIQTGVALIDEKSASLLGYALEDLEPDCFGAWMSFKHPDDREESTELLLRHSRGETESYSFESRMRKKDGDWAWILGRGKVSDWDEYGKPLRMFGTHIDVTERKRAEVALRESEKKYRQLFESIMDAIVLLDMDGTIIYANTAFQALLGYTIGELLTLNDSDITPAEWRAVELGSYSKQILERGYSDTYEKEYRKKDGSSCPVEIRVFLLKDDADRPSSMWAIVRSVADRKQTEEKITKLLAEKESILKEVHHRIKNNMGTMISLLSLQAETMKDPAAAAALKDAENRLRSMGVLYDRLYHSENLREMSAGIYLPTLAEEIVSVFPNGPWVRVETQVDDFMIGVKALSTLGIILNEILTNAMKYAFVGRDRGLIRVSASREGSRATIVVEDDGIGIPESVGIDDSPGFGLMLIGTLTRQLDGSVRIERGTGTKFLLEIGI